MDQDDEAALDIRRRIMGSSIFGPPEPQAQVSRPNPVPQQPVDVEPEADHECESGGTAYPTINYQDMRLRPPPPKGIPVVVNGSSLILDRVPMVKPIELEASFELRTLGPFPDFRVETVKLGDRVEIGMKTRVNDLKDREREPMRMLIGEDLRGVRDRMMAQATVFKQKMDLLEI